MAEFDEIVKMKIKPKEKMALLAQEIRNRKNGLGDLKAAYENAPLASKGYYMEAVELITAKDPKFIEGHLDFFIFEISAKSPSVKREAGRIIANVAGAFPDKVAKAIPALLENTEDDGTVVRWSAATGLTAIALNNAESRKKLLGLFNEILKREENNGVKNIYLKATKKLEKIK
jgi:hypothetical protein